MQKQSKKSAKKFARKHNYTLHNLKNRFDNLRLDVVGARQRKAAEKSAQ